MNNKICVITGCNSGIGKATAITLAKRGYEILMLVRESEKSKIAYEQIKIEAKSDLVKLFFVDLSSIESIKNVVDQINKVYTKIDVLINNAGVYKREEKKSENGFEMTIAVNYIAVFLLTNMLLPLLKNAQYSRIINVSSMVYKSGKIHLDMGFNTMKYNGIKSYANSKLLVIYFTKELAKRLKVTDITVNSVHPGVVGTNVFRDYPNLLNNFIKLIISKPSEGAKPIVYLATADQISEVSGKYFNKVKVKQTVKVANDEALSLKIWHKTEELINSC